MNTKTLTRVAILGLGWLFAIGLGVSGMTDTRKVIGFLNVSGDWDPSLLGVMGGAIVVFGIGHALVRRRERPMFSDRFHVTTRRDINPRLIAGAALFGAGWGLAGVCPGPGLTSLVTGAQTSAAFVAAMVLGMIGFDTLHRKITAQA